MKKFLITLSLVLFIAGNAYCEEVKNAKDLTLYLLDNFKYTSDVVTKGHQEYVQEPGILEYSKAGDCDDFAIYTWVKLTALGYKAQPYCFYLLYRGELVGHAITVFLAQDNTYSVFSNQRLLLTNETTALKAIKYVYPTWTKIHSWNPRHFGQVTKKDFNSDLHLEAVNLKNISRKMLKKKQNEKNHLRKSVLVK